MACNFVSYATLEWSQNAFYFKYASRERLKVASFEKLSDLPISYVLLLIIELSFIILARNSFSVL